MTCIYRKAAKRVRTVLHPYLSCLHTYCNKHLVTNIQGMGKGVVFPAFSPAPQPHQGCQSCCLTPKPWVDNKVMGTLEATLLGTLLGSVCPRQPLHPSKPPLYPHRRDSPLLNPPAPSPCPIPPAGPYFPLPFPHCLPLSLNASTPQALLFASQRRCTLLKLSPQHITFPKEGAASIWIHTTRGLYGCSTTQDMRGHHIALLLLSCHIPTQEYGHNPSYPPMPPSSIWVHPGNFASLKANGPPQAQQALEGGRPWWEPSHCHKTGRERFDFSPYTASLCTGPACRGAFHELWQIPVLKDAYKQRKYINPPIKHTGSSGPSACLDTSACQSSTMISACGLQKKPAF